MNKQIRSFKRNSKQLKLTDAHSINYPVHTKLFQKTSPLKTVKNFIIWTNWNFNTFKEK